MSSTYRYAKSILPIAAGEFSAALRNCQPRAGWGHSIAVSNSGGPDSTSLMFLMKRFIDEVDEAERDFYPTRVVSVNVDHRLQPASKAMSELCEKRALAMGIQHINKRISWDTEKFPELPTSGIETMARLARHSLVHSAMCEADCTVIAFGHHLDDQVETSMARLAKGSTLYGAAGMKHVRRWGMGASEKIGALGWTGIEGMNHWLIRPLLQFPKDRLLATCDHHQLQYVVDQSNFQPSHTLRNAIRGFLASETKTPSEYAEAVNLPVQFSVDLKRAHASLVKLAETDPPDFRATVLNLAARTARIDREVDDWVLKCRVPAWPPGAYVLDPAVLLEAPEDIRIQILTRILRYVSPYPWGSLHASGNYQIGPLNVALEKLQKPFDNPNFVVGGGVMWSAVKLKRNGFVHSNKKPSGPRGWVAARQPPPRTQRGTDNPTIVDVTQDIVDRLHSRSKFEVLYDCRFMIRFDLEHMPKWVSLSMQKPDAQLLIIPADRYHTPQVILRQDFVADAILHTEVLGFPETSLKWKPFGKSEWIQMQWIRTLTG